VAKVRFAKRKRATVCSCELNEEAFDLHVENNRVNKVEEKVRMVMADAMRLPGLLNERFDRILMPLPSRSNLYLGAALSLAKPGGLIHYYRHMSGKNVAEAEANLAHELSSIAGERRGFTTRKVREIGPRYIELVAEIVAA
jgi:tRNA (guanine37-N1)-methyltransferase